MKFRTVSVPILLCLIYLTVPLATDAQPPAGKVWRVGLFHVGLDHEPPTLAPLREGLKRLGYEDKNIRLDWRNQADEDAGARGPHGPS